MQTFNSAESEHEVFQRPQGINIAFQLNSEHEECNEDEFSEDETNEDECSENECNEDECSEDERSEDEHSEDEHSEYDNVGDISEIVENDNCNYAVSHVLIQ